MDTATATATDPAAHPLAALFDSLAGGRFPPPDGTVRVVPTPTGGAAVVGAVVAFTAHHVVAAAVPAAEVLARLPPGDVGAPTGAPFLAWLARRLDAVGGGLDAVLLAPPASGAAAGVEEDGAPPALVPHPGPAGHPRVARARRLRREVAVYADPAGRGLVTLGRGLAGAGSSAWRWRRRTAGPGWGGA